MVKNLKIVVFAVFVQIVLMGMASAAPDEPVRQVLDNGMTVILLENHNAPVVTIQAWVGAGSATEGEFLGSGISHFVEHMLFKGTERRSVGQIGQEVKEAGGQTNAYTGQDKTVYYITFHSDYFDKALDIMADVLMHSVFEPAEVEREREVIIKEIKMNRDDPFRHLYLMAQETAYAVHPYGLPVIGYENLLKKVSREDLLTYYRRLYVPNNMALVAVGDFKADEALLKVADAFSEFERTSIAPIVLPQEPRQQGKRERVERFPVTVAQSMIGVHGPSIESNDMYAMDVLAIILGGGDTSRLYRELRQNRSIVYNVEAWSATPKDPGMFWIASSFEPENYEAVKAGIWEQIEKLRSEPVSEHELETARAKVLSNYIFSRESVEGQARSLGYGELDAHDIHFDRRYVESVSRVTADDITRVVKTYFRNDASVVATLMPGQTTPAPSEPQRQPEQATETRIQKEVLANGLTLLMRENHDNQSVAVRLVVLGGARAETPSTTGITNLMSEAMLKGTATRTAEQIASTIESRGGTIEAFSGYNSFGFELDLLSGDLETGLAVLGDIVANPSFPPEHVEREKTAAIANIKSVNDEIFPSAMKLFRETMFAQHPYSFLVEGNTEVVKSLTPEDLRRYHSESVAASRMVLSVFGDIDPSRTLDLVRTSFGQLKRGEPFSADTEADPFPDRVRQASKRMDKEQLAILVGFRGASVTDPDRYPLELVATSLNSQGGKLFTVLRDERGLAYSVGAFNILGVEPGAFVMYIVTVPEKREEAVAGMFEVIRDLRENGIGEQELERTKIEALGTHAISLQTNGQIAMEASFDELYGLGHDAYRRYDEKIRSLTPEDIRLVAEKVLDPERYAIVFVGNVE
ncbi:MAG: pitrilysin family protein [Candidatus Abyssubacteria bacterium]